MFLVFLLVGMTLSFSTSTTFLKNVVDQWDWQMFGLAVVFGLVGYGFNFVLLRHSDLGVAAVMTSASQIILMNLIAHFYRGEVLTPLQLLGIGLAVLAVLFVMLPANN